MMLNCNNSVCYRDIQCLSYLEAIAILPQYTPLELEIVKISYLGLRSQDYTSPI